MKIMVIGSGGREHAIIKCINKSNNIDEIYCLPGNGGIAQDAICVDIDAIDLDNIVKFAVNERIDYAIVAPDDPLAIGCVDKLNEVGIQCFGPKANASIIESSKVFAKNLMKKYNIPTAKYEVFNNADDALYYIKNVKMPAVIKADGLALGKGVVIANNIKEADDAIKSIMQNKIFGESGNNIVVEEFLEGPEVSILAFTDGKTIVPMVSSMDHKRAFNDNKGPNTGGMGCVAPNPYYTSDIASQCMEQIFIPTIKAMNNEGRTFQGCLYFGLMITKFGPKVIEYNCRFGDPETQVILPLLETDLLEIMQACTNGTLDKLNINFSNKCCACVVMASNGYPGKYNKGYEIEIPNNLLPNIYMAGVQLINNKLVTSGGRVIGVSSVKDNLGDAINDAYNMVDKIKFKNAYYRKDIGKSALNIK